MTKCSEVLQCSDGPNNKVSNIIRRYIDNRKLLLICIFYYHILSYSLGSIFIGVYMVVFLFNTVIYVILLFYIYVFLLYDYVSSSCQLALFGYPD